MNLEEMKKFASLSDDERAMEIQKAEWAKEADEDYQSTSLAQIFKPMTISGRNSLPACCEHPLFGVRNQNELVFYFDRHGDIVSDVFDVVTVGDAYCTSCNSKVKTPQSYIDNWVEECIIESNPTFRTCEVTA